MPRRFKISRALFFCATALPPCLIAALILKYGVDFPFEDQWSLAHLFVRFKEGTLTLDKLFGLQNEYRQFFPNLIIIGLGWLTRWDVRFEMFFSFLLAALISFNVHRLGKQTFGAGDSERRRIAFLLSNLLIFSPVQYLNWLMGEQLVYFFPAACVTTCLVIACSGMGPWKRFALCACLSTVSTFSAANGIFCWVVVFPALARGGARGVSKGTRLRLGLACASGFALCAAGYFYNYQSPAHHPSPLAALGHPLRAAAHFLSLLGSTLAGESAYVLPVAVAAGAVLFSLYVAHAVVVRRAGTEHELTRRSVGWLMLGAYSLLTAATVTAGRSAIGVAQSSASRYTTFTLYLIVALIHLVALSRGAEAGKVRARNLLPARLIPAVLVLMLGLHALACVIALQQMGLLRTRLLQAKACHMFVNVVPDTACLARHVLPELEDLRGWTNALDELGFWRPGLVKSNRVEEFADATPASGDYGSFDVLSKEGDTYLASGRAMLPHRGEPADAVLLAYETTEGAHVAFAQAELKNRGYVFIRFWQNGARQDPGWRKSFRASELPHGATRLTAWAFDAQTGKAFKLEGTHELKAAQ
ncbi:MAG TPA: hypothetical protein VFS10_13550 [Pyrinomonadaceae bacterium]|nr:hypothetical protein [Pyrinomonadaceae bacterium]